MIKNQSEATRTLLFLLLVLTACQPLSAPAEERSFKGENALHYIELQLEMGERYPGTAGHAQMQRWLIEELTDLGWATEQQTFQYEGSTLTNIVAYSPAYDEQGAILLGAHYDTRRFADRDQAFPGHAVPGANDGASGVAVLLEIARIFSGHRPANLILVFFDAEDQGRIDSWDWAVGSRYFVSQLKVLPRAVVIVDMVGDRDLSLPIERSSDPALIDEIWLKAEALGYEAFTRELGPTLIDDHIPFLQAGIPAIDIIDFDYPFWHTTQDTLDKVSSESLEIVGRTLEYWIIDHGIEAVGGTQ